MMDERSFVLVRKEKEREERGKTLVWQVNNLLDACSDLKGQIAKALKNCLRQDRNRFA